jgi:1-aminocyclopropane-1-carboxylate deaminase/D-cysteine desulfhydrase-like pyridoxal-dependent ACC family enzyme
VTALFAAFPSLRGRVPWRPLGRFPTRVHALPGLADRAVDLWVKRDDESGERYGGNKVRKLEFILAEAEARGVRRLVTVGGYGSHHVLATALYGRACGFAVEAVVFPQPATPHVLETLRAASACGVHFRVAASYAGVAPRLLAARARRGALMVAPGGSSPTGTYGYVAAGLELAAQIRDGVCPRFDDVYVPLGSCGTAAGLWLGLRAAGLPTRVIGVRVVDEVVCNRPRTIRLARAVERRLGLTALPEWRPSRADLVVDGRFFGGGYGVPSAAAQAAVARARSVGLRLETTYTGKTLAALLADAEAGLLAGRKVLFVDTFSSVDLAPLLAAAPPTDTLPRRLARLVDGEAPAAHG